MKWLILRLLFADLCSCTGQVITEICVCSLSLPIAMNRAARDKVGMYFRAGVSWEMQEGKDKLNAGIHASLCLNPGTEELPILQSMSSVCSYSGPANTVLLLNE